MKVTINFPITVVCDVKSASNADESAFGIDRTDFLELTNIQMPSKITLPASAVAIIEE